MRIRRADTEDAVAIAELGALIQQLHHEQRPDWFKPANAGTAVALYEELLDSSDVSGYIAEDDSGTLGFVIVKVLRRTETPLDWPQTVVYLDQIGVAPSARRRGVGHELFQCVRELADEVSASRLYLTTWEFNSDAHRFFETEGLTTEMRRMSMAWPPQ